MNFDLLTPSPGSGEGVGYADKNICFHIAAFLDFPYFDMQHDHVFKKLSFDLLAASPGSEGRGGGLRA